jgi:transposase InsO family protein
MYSVEFKLKVLKHVKKYNIHSAVDAFDITHSSIYLWQKQLQQNHGSEYVLQNKSTRPKKVRTRVGNWDYRIERFIQKIRITHPGLTKEKVWKLLCNHNLELKKVFETNQINNSPPISRLPSIATVGRMIADLKYNRQIPDWSRKLSFYANTSTFRVKQRKKVKKTRPIKKPFTVPGQRVQIDTVIIIKKGIRRYILNAIDVYSRMSFSYGYTNLSSTTAKDFFIKLQQVLPFIDNNTEIQNDNGSEFMKNFQEHLQNQSITQVWNYPHSPKMNAYIERFNGSIQFEFVYKNLDTLFETNTPATTNTKTKTSAIKTKTIKATKTIKTNKVNLLTEFNTKLMHHLVWYNTQRPHLSLDLKSPVEFLLSSSQFSEMWWTRT